MTNYNLEEFKAWLEEKPERKADLPKWPAAFSHWEKLTKIKGWTEYAAIVNQWKKEIDQTISQLETQLQAAKQTQSQLEEQLKDCRETLTTNQEKVKELNRELTEQKELISKLQQDNRDLLNDIHQHKQNIQTHEQKTTSLTEQARPKEQRILALEADKTDLIQQLSQAQTQYQIYLTQEKAQLTQEIQLIKEVIH